MNCRQVQSLYFNYADGTLDQPVRSGIENHSSGCTTCCLYYSAQSSLALHITAAVATELADLHFRQGSLNPELIPADRRFPLKALVRQIAYAVPALLLFGLFLWPLKPHSPQTIDDPLQTSYMEAYQHFEMNRAGKRGETNLIAPVAVIIQPGSPARVIEIDGPAAISAALK